MALATPVTTAPSVNPLATRIAAPEHLAIIQMLEARGAISRAEAERLVMCPAALDDVVMLSLLHERHDLSDIDYAFEKGEIIRHLAAPRR